MKQVAFALALSGAAVLVACADQTPPGPTSTMAEPSPVVPQPETIAPPKPIIEDGQLGSLVGSTDTRVVRIDPQELAVIETGMSCSMDSVNLAPAKGARVPLNSQLQISGWVEYDPALLQNLMVVLRGDEVGTYAFRGALVGDRPDLAEKVNKTAVSDFTGIATLQDVPAGLYRVYFVRKDEAGSAKCIANDNILIAPMPGA